jgi:hypothetical protein
MNKTVKLRCDECGEVIFTGEIWERPGAGDEVKTDITGKYFDGAGRCRECGRELCAACGLVDGICKDCRKEEEE